MKSTRNKTIDFSLSSGIKYFERCLNINDNLNLPNVINKNLNGDCLEIMDKLPKNFVDLLIVDPPYNLTKDFGNSKFVAQSHEEYYDYTESWIRKAKPLLKETSSIYVCCDWKSSLIISQVLQKYFNIQNRITWQREKGRGALQNWKNSLEDIWFATMSNNYYFDLEKVKIRRKVIAPYKQDGIPKDWQETLNGKFRDTCPSNFWDDISIPYWSMPENTAHPTQKPEKLIAKMILASSKDGDIVFDPFLGSGTTSVVAKKLDRRYVGIEQDKTYCAWAEKRLELAETNKSIQGFSDSVFWERNTANEQLIANNIEIAKKRRRNVQ